MVLGKELETYRRELPNLLRHEGKHVLIKGDEVIGVYKNHDRALAAGYRRYGPRVSFLVKEVRAVDPPVFMHRDSIISRVPETGSGKRRDSHGPRRRGARRIILEKELATYRRELPNLLRHEGKHVLIKGDEVIGVYKSWERALAAGYRRIGLDTPFLVKEISAVEKPVFVRFHPRIFRVPPHPTPDER